MPKPVTISVVGDDSKFTASMDSVGKSLKGLGKKAALAGTAIAAGLGAGLVGLGKLGSSFNEARTEIRVATGATDDDLADLQDSFKNVLKDVPTSFGDAGGAIADLNTRLGLTGDNLETSASQFLNLSRITKTDVAGNIDNITRVFGDWNVAAGDQSDIMDQMFRASQASGIGIDELATSMVRFGAPLRNIGFDIEDTQALFAVFNKTGVNTDTVIAGIKIGVGTLAKAGEEVPETFRRIVDEITELGPGTEATGLAIELFGQRAGPDLADAISGGKFELDGMLDAITNGSDTIADAAADTEQFGEKWTKIKNRVFVGLEPLATGIFDALGKGMDAISPTIDKITAGLTEFGETLKTGVPSGDGSPLQTFALMIREKVIPAVAGFVGWIRDELVPAVIDFAGNVADFVIPIAEKMAEIFRDDISPAIAEFVGWIRDQLLPKFDDLVAKVKENLEPTIESLTDLFNDGIKPAMQSVSDLIRDHLAPMFLKVVDILIEKVVPFVLQDFIPALAKISEIILGKVVPAIADVVGWLVDELAPVLEDNIDKFISTWKGAEELAEKTIAAFKSFIDFIKGVPGDVSDALSGIWDGIPKPPEFITDIIGGLSGAGESALGFLGFAAGTGSAPGGLSVVGERGPELVNLPAGSRVTPNHALAAGGGGLVQNFIVNEGMNVHQLSQAAAWEARLSGR